MGRAAARFSLVSFTLLAIACAAPDKQGTQSQSAAGTPEAQLARGEAVYAERCASCHGAQMEGKSALDLAGAEAGSRWQGLTAADLHQRVTTMPYGAANSLSPQQYADLTADI